MNHIHGLNCKYLFRVKNIFKKRQKRYCTEEKGFYICTRYGGNRAIEIPFEVISSLRYRIKNDSAYQ